MHLVSVILPVYNAERFLREAIDSVLNQTYEHFELILINDGSTDKSGEIIVSYTDKRIKYLENETNSGLVFTLNKGVDAAAGKFIARMDSDDVCMPTRFEKQVRYLEQHNASIVACTIDIIDENNKGLPPWKDDRENISPQQIRNFLPRNNCIAHPSIMAETALLKTYRYDAEQVEAEDYDLWLRMEADGISIHKLSEPLLKYRFLQSGLTRKEGLSAFERLSRTKKRFARKYMKEKSINPFVLRVYLSGLMDSFRSSLKKRLPFL